MTDIFAKVIPTARDASMSDSEWKARQELACAYRLFDHFGWHELIYNHITVRVPDTPYFLINPFGLRYGEVRASNLVKIDVEGQIIGESAYSVNPAGFIVHSAIHAARPDAHAVAHTHTTAGQAVACQKGGLLPLSFTSMFYTDAIAYHDFEGITLDRSERERLAKNLGSKSLMILRNHGLLACGPSLAHAFLDLYHLQRACEVQVVAQAAGEAMLLRPPPEAAVRSALQHRVAMDRGLEPAMAFAAMARMMMEKDSTFLQ
ncbi:MULTISPECIES: class II aldolase/adducin family protein [unclassified Variovorax]|uniref:class II aldolase/adducin family protein n=1 Tax=unclassified Variovorax TaxID=663243 RepID=UPI002B228737|nr:MULTISPECIES: class II aldolase/adducin family protein [unclassified Variovorax]MEB0055883.1 class II aldolase/adducin family protein [Variovorax sp. LG9.2]MEB0113280.1 class II aldolase/adducin family protein [Variovorax sp. RTB1]